MEMNCIFCDAAGPHKSIEHIVPESMGNEYYLLPEGVICADCNNKFSAFEGKALTKTVLGMERSRFGIKTKKGKPASGKAGDLEFKGHPEFKRGHVFLDGLKPEDVKNWNPKDRTFHVEIVGFEKSDMATCKLILKMGIEALYKSQGATYDRLDLSQAKRYLIAKDNQDWPFVTTKVEVAEYQFTSIPKMLDKWRLKIKETELKLCEADGVTALLLVRYGGIQMITNILNRDLGWTKKYDIGKDASLYPVHMRKK